ncbi:HD-GYP domain-containing protein [Candidatus Latescibacterota bacterium]
MRLCPLKDIQKDMILGKSIYLLNGKLLLGAGTSITEQLKNKLQKRGYTYIYIIEEGTDDVIPEEVVSDEVSFSAKNQLAKIIYDIQNETEFKNASVTKAMDLIEQGYLQDALVSLNMRSMIEEVLKDIISSGSKILNSVMIKTADSFFLDHALNVTVLTLLIGMKYRFSKKELLDLGVGSFLHDIGKIVIEQINEKDDPAITEKLYPEHPMLGYKILAHAPIISTLESVIACQHHERQDGKGFPMGLKGQNLPPVKNAVRKTKGYIFRLAEICSVANSYDNIAYNPKMPDITHPVDAIKQIINDASTKHNKEIVQTLITIVPYYPVGAAVKLVYIWDQSLIGHTGVVAKIHEDNINKPVIILTKNKYNKKIKSIVIDTATVSNIELQLLL